jgi:trigger factor
MDIKRVALDAVNETIVITVCMDYKGQYKKRINEKCLMTVKGLEKGCA